VRAYAFEVAIPDSGAHIVLTARIDVARTAAVDALRLDLLRGMDVAGVTVGARDVSYERDTLGVRVSLPPWPARCSQQAVEASVPECITRVTVRASGTPTDGLIVTHDQSNRWLYFADHWPNRARNWLPVVDHPSDKATVEWTVSAPRTHRVIANGDMVFDSATSSGRHTVQWRSTIPIPVYLMVIGVAPMVTIPLGDTACGLAERTRCVTQSVWEFPELAPRTPPGFAAAADIVEWLSRTVAPFPFEKLAHVQSSTRFGGMENASAIFYSENAFRAMTLDSGLVAHETAHQWFGDAVTPARWADLWLSEGFATYYAALWRLHATGEIGFRREMAAIRQRVFTAAVVQTRPVVDSTESDLLALLNANSYQKGAAVLHMLRLQVGDSVFASAIRAYYARHKLGNATTDDLRAVVEQVARADMRWFFEQWLHRPGFARLTTAWTYDNSAVTVTMTQDTSMPPYRLRIPIAVEDESGVVTSTVVDVQAVRESRAQLNVRLSAPPRSVRFDPDGDVLAIFTASVGGRSRVGDSVARADALKASGQLSAAESLYYDAARMAPQDATARFALGRYLASRGAFAVGATLMDEALLFGADTAAIAPTYRMVLQAAGQWSTVASFRARDLSSADRQRAAWLTEHPPTITGADSTTVGFEPSSANGLGRVRITIGTDTLAADIDPAIDDMIIGDYGHYAEHVHTFAGTAVVERMSIGDIAFERCPVRVDRALGPARARIGLVLLASLAPTVDAGAGVLTLRRDGRVDRQNGRRVPVVFAFPGVRIARADRLVPLESAAGRAVLAEARWTLDLLRGELVLEVDR
jgi:aminopeptidase N